MTVRHWQSSLRHREPGGGGGAGLHVASATPNTFTLNASTPTTVTVTGTGFSQNTAQVFIGELAGQTTTWVSDTTLTFEFWHDVVGTSQLTVHDLGTSEISNAVPMTVTP